MTWRVEKLLDMAGRLIASLGLLFVIGGFADDDIPRKWILLGSGLGAFISGLFAWGLSAVIVELQRISRLLEKGNHNGG